MAAIRHCKVCGLFYPSGRRELEQTIAALLRRVERKSFGGAIRGLVVPHAGYAYSGYTAMHGYALLERQTYDTVVIVAPSHAEYFDGISVYDGDAYVTPLGSVEVNRPLREEFLNASPHVQSSVAGHGNEHAIEVQLPMLQFMMGKFSILPVVMGDQRKGNCDELGRALGKTFYGKNVLLVASTDLSHYHSYQEAMQLDKVIIEDISSFDPESLVSHLDTGMTEACGGGPAIAVMSALKNLGARRMEILHQCNSGDITGDHSQVVGYVSAVGLA